MVTMWFYDSTTGAFTTAGTITLLAVVVLITLLLGTMRREQNQTTKD